MGNEKVAVLGPLGTYTHEAAFQTFGPDVIYDERGSIADVFSALSSRVPLGVVPQENSIFGNVVETYDLLRTSDPIFICGEITLKVQHCLLVKRGVKLHQIKRIMSHEQALGQCSMFIAEKLPTAHVLKTTSTAAAAQALLDNPPDCAAICSSMCATLFEGLEVIFTSIQNEQSNFTRFYIVSQTRYTTLPPILTEECQMKALVRISSPELYSSSGYDIMKYLRILDLRAARIDRRPSLKAIPFHSLYFIEVHGSGYREGPSGNLQSWTTEVETAILRVKDVGGDITLAGLW